MAFAPPPHWLARTRAWLRTLPQQCHCCRRWPSHGLLCPDCWQRFAPTAPTSRCTGCALPLPAHASTQCGKCLRQPPPWQQALAWCDYAYPWSDVLHHWKFAQQPGLTRHIAHWLAQQPEVMTALAQVDVVLPIPLSAQRMRERGYNPAALLARHLAGPRAHLHALVRPVHTSAQSQLGRRQRLRNLQGAFALTPAGQRTVAGQRVLLIDDVMTTGATFTAACSALIAAGSGPITVLCVARTPAPPAAADGGRFGRNTASASA